MLAPPPPPPCRHLPHHAQLAQVSPRKRIRGKQPPECVEVVPVSSSDEGTDEAPEPVLPCFAFTRGHRAAAFGLSEYAFNLLCHLGVPPLVFNVLWWAQTNVGPAHHSFMHVDYFGGMGRIAKTFELASRLHHSQHLHPQATTTTTTAITMQACPVAITTSRTTLGRTSSPQKVF